MKELTRKPAKGDRIWAQPNDTPCGTLCIAVVISIIRIPNTPFGEPYAAVRYLNKQNGFECIPLAQIKGFCDDEEYEENE